MAVFRTTEYVETVPLLRQLGYDPNGIARGTLSSRGYSDGVQDHRWLRPDHWERIEAAMILDEANASAPRSAPDVVNHPPHYTSDPSGVECITITRHRNFNVGNAIKYLWRAGLKVEANKTDEAKQVEDLRKAVWYIEDEIKRLEAQRENA